MGTVTGKVEGTRTDVGSVTGKAEGAGTDDEGIEVMDTDTGTIVDAMEDVGCAVTAVETVTGTVVGVEVGIVGILSPGLVPNSYTLNFSDPIPPDLLLNGTCMQRKYEQINIYGIILHLFSGLYIQRLRTAVLFVVLSLSHLSS